MHFGRALACRSVRWTAQRPALWMHCERGINGSDLIMMVIANQLVTITITAVIPVVIVIGKTK